MIAWIIGFSAAIIICLMHYLVNERPHEREPLELPEPFIVSEHYARIEQAALDTLESQAPVDQTIILWWGLDGLRLDENGDLKWISRKKLKPVNQSVFYQPCQTIDTLPSGATQNTQTTMEEIAGLKMQLDMMSFNLAMQSQMQGFNLALKSRVAQSPWYYAGLTDCCCNRLIRIDSIR